MQRNRRWWCGREWVTDCITRRVVLLRKVLWLWPSKCTNFSDFTFTFESNGVQVQRKGPIKSFGDIGWCQHCHIQCLPPKLALEDRSNPRLDLVIISPWFPLVYASFLAFPWFSWPGHSLMSSAQLFLFKFPCYLPLPVQGVLVFWYLPILHKSKINLIYLTLNSIFYHSSKQTQMWRKLFWLS